jgi:hypothetical protein
VVSLIAVNGRSAVDDVTSEKKTICHAKRCRIESTKKKWAEIFRQYCNFIKFDLVVM